MRDERIPTLVEVLRSRLKLWRADRVGSQVVVLGRVWIHGGGRVVIGDRVVLDGRTVPVELHAEPGGELVLGDDVRVEGGASLEAQESVTIGAGCRIGAFAKILDNDFHPVAGDRHRRPASRPVTIGPGAEVGARAIILPGSQVERGARIGPGVVVTRHKRAGESGEAAR